MHKGQEILPKATVDWRMTKASSQPHRGCHDQLERVDQRETAVASTTSATGTMKKQPHPMLYPKKPAAKLTEAMS